MKSNSHIYLRYDIPHVVNNAYGLQCGRCCHLINEGLRQSSTSQVYSTASGFAESNGSRAPIATTATNKNAKNKEKKGRNMECRKESRVDIFVQSTDKNFMVPVGGSIVCSRDEQLITSISQMYAGRASMSPLLDLLITLLAMGKNGYRRLLDERRKVHLEYMRSKLEQLATKYGERVLKTNSNKVSCVHLSREAHKCSISLLLCTSHESLYRFLSR